MSCRARGTVTILLVCILINTARSDLCLTLGDDDDETSLAKFIHKSAMPRAGQEAGIYTHGLTPEGRDTETMAECLLSCCDSDTCNLILFHLERCYLIACNRSQPNGCDPVTNSNDPKLENTFLITVRSIEETTPTETDDVSMETGACHPGEDRDCGVGEECTLVHKGGATRSVCQCQRGLQRDTDTGLCTVRSADDTCEYGLNGECLAHEECVAQSARSRVGTCECVQHYHRDPVTQHCVPDSEDVDKNLDTDGTDTDTDDKMLSDEPDKSTEETSIKSPDEKKSGTDVSTLSKSTTVRPDQPVTAPPLSPLVVSAGENREITLPNNEVTLNAFVVPNDDKAGYKYKWELVAQPDHDKEGVGDMVGMNSNSLHLSKLTAGLYTFKVVVTADGKYGEAYVNITVNEPARINVPPVAVIKPPSQSVNQPNDVVLDGSVSTDDDKITQYHWEQVAGPVEATGIDEDDADRSMLVLKGLKPGEYKYKLTVTDSDGIQTYAFANVTVIKETDYPPRANAGSNVIISLPQNSVTLYGNASTDDKGIASFEWIKKSDDKLTADMKGVRTPILQLENLEKGDYTFTLKVTDTAGNQDTADVHVFVKAEQNKPPVANAGHNRTIWLPQDVVTLDASNSSDDQRITSYRWTQIRGPSSVIIDNADRAVCTVSKLVAGVYTFKVTVTDAEKQQGTSVVYITVKQDNNKAPVARAGGATMVTLPAPLVALDGTQSSDDRGIVSYLWKRQEASLAAGVIVNNSDTQPTLLLTGLVPGRYLFSLTVTDDDGLTNSDTATLTVNSPDNRGDLIELRLDVDIRSFTQRDKKNLESQIALLLNKNFPDTEVHIQELAEDRSSGSLLVVLYVSQTHNEVGEDVIPGSLVAGSLRDRLWSDSNLLDFTALSVDTVICQNNCSGHGHCDQSTKRCVCEAFWMENPFRAYLYSTSNCQWSVLYVIIIVFITMVTMIGVIWGLVFLCKRWYWTRPKKRHRYTLLDETEEDDTKGSMEMTQKDSGYRRKRLIPPSSTSVAESKIGKSQNSSLMVSESDFSSDEETIFINRKANGHAGKNGFIRAGKTKVRA